jgi:tubulin polyglutamylase TTLL4
MTPGFKILESTHTYNCVVNSLKMAGFSLNTGSKWNSLWTGMIRGGRLKSLNEYQRINHFAGSWSLGRKDSMWRSVQRMRRMHGKAFDICP